MQLMLHLKGGSDLRSSKRRKSLDKNYLKHNLIIFVTLK